MVHSNERAIHNGFGDGLGSVKKEMGTNSDANPFVSVIVPVYNDPEGIRATLEAVVNQTYPSTHYEVLPVDNNSSDSTGAVIESIAETNPDLISVLTEREVQSSYAARNEGIERAKGDILVFIDADMTVDPDWLDGIVRTLEETDCVYLGYRVEIVTSEDPTIWERYDRALAFPIQKYLERNQYSPTCALAVRRKVIDTVRKFDETLVSGGDKELGRRVARAGLKQCYSESVEAYHPARSSIKSHLSKAKRVGRGHEQVRQRHPEIATTAHPLHPLKFLPPSPWRLRQRFSGSGEERLSNLFAFYAIAYLLKLVQAWGALEEYQRTQ